MRQGNSLTILLTILFATGAAVTAYAAEAKLLVELPNKYDTPDGMCLLPNGDVLVAIPNVNSWLADTEKAEQDPPPVIIKIGKDKYMRVCYDKDGKSHSGEVKTPKGGK